MPDGTDGWHSDWYNDGAFGAPKWETYHVDQLIPFIENECRVRSNRHGRIAAGYSMGGVGSLPLGAVIRICTLVCLPSSEHRTS